MYLMTSTRHGVAAKELERQIGCTYKTAWRMAHELRKLMATADGGSGKLHGHVEIDETFVGGRNRGKGRKASLENKTVIFGMLEREGKLIAGPVPNRLSARWSRSLPRMLNAAQKSAQTNTALIAAWPVLASTTVQSITLKRFGLTAKLTLIRLKVIGAS